MVELFQMLYLYYIYFHVIFVLAFTHRTIIFFSTMFGYPLNNIQQK